ncbi:MAG: M23 family metallopeptidase [Candidatus Babeliales bacterium]
MNLIKAAIYFLLFATIAYSGWWIYTYTFDTEAPVITLEGLDEGSTHKDMLKATLNGSDRYRIRAITVTVDDEPIVDNKIINRSSVRLPLTFDTHAMAQGKHTLKVEAQDGSYAQNKMAFTRTFFVDNLPLHFSLMRPTGDVRIFQGKTIHVQFQLNKSEVKAHATLFGQTYPCFPVTKSSLVWECFVPVPCEQDPGEYVLELVVEDGVGGSHKEEIPLQIVAFPFKTSSLTVSQEKMDKELEMSRSQQELDDRFAALFKESPQEKLWHGVFYAPIEIKRKTTDYGTIRTTQLRGRYMHKAVDVINLPKSVVWAPQDGIIVMKDRFAYSGNTIIIDHGFGIFTLLYHLDNFANVNVGDKVKRGSPVGTLGMTGYASGYHLHWEMRINNVHVDPEQWIDSAF